MPAKTDVTCPHCHHVQQEPRGVISTFCRGCGEHFEVGVVPEAPPTRRMVAAKAVHCYRCQADHDVSPFAKTTICPSCNAAITLGDLVIDFPASRPVDIRGRLTIRAGANLNHARIICTSARIEGKVTGAIQCEKELELRASGRLSFQARAGHTLVAKGVVIELAAPLETGGLDLRGEIIGDVHCSGAVVIHKGGGLRGFLDARQIRIDRGGFWVGGGEIAPAEDG